MTDHRDIKYHVSFLPIVAVVVMAAISLWVLNSQRTDAVEEALAARTELARFKADVECRDRLQAAVLVTTADQVSATASFISALATGGDLATARAQLQEAESAKALATSELDDVKNVCH